MAVKIKTHNGTKLVPTAKEVSAQVDATLQGYVPKTGGEFTGEVQIPSRGDSFVLADLRDKFPATEKQLKQGLAYLAAEVSNGYAKKDHGHTLATTAVAGFMSKTDKSNLELLQQNYGDGILADEEGNIRLAAKESSFAPVPWGTAENITWMTLKAGTAKRLLAVCSGKQPNEYNAYIVRLLTAQPQLRQRITCSDQIALSEFFLENLSIGKIQFTIGS
ncbi:MAG: hypothetical protein NC218_02550 [Acetobacter sp.]|nr:hypothetical protein [Acetobacter sp.]